MAGGDRGALSRYQAVAQRKAFAEALVENYPDLTGRGAEFACSPELASMPALRYPALLRAGLAVARNRRAKPGDGYDIDHLTVGLSRCDILTADGGMTQLVNNHKLLPTGCRIFNQPSRYLQLGELCWSGVFGGRAATSLPLASRVGLTVVASIRTSPNRPCAMKYATPIFARRSCLRPRSCRPAARRFAAHCRQHSRSVRRGRGGAVRFS
jgi:hypothetical protein